MAKKIEFTEREDELIRAICHVNPQNLREGFGLIAKELKKTPQQIQNRWYNALREDRTIFTINSGNTVYRNTKNVWMSKPRPEYNISGTTKLTIEQFILDINKK